MQYDLVFEGGGAKGMVFVGAMQEFEAQGHTYGRLLGTSAGAITASLLAAGYNSQRMLAALQEERDGQPVFATFLGIPGPFTKADVDTSATVELLGRVNIPFVPESWEDRADRIIVQSLLKTDRFKHVFSFVERGGWFKATPFVEWIIQKLDDDASGITTGYADMTLAEFHRATQRELCLVASDTTAQQILVLNHRTAPDCPLVWAIRMSMSIPLVWCEVKWLAEWGLYRGTDVTDHFVVDGGILSNFPIELLVSTAPNVGEVMGETTSDRVLGLLIDEKLAVANASAASGNAGFQWGKLRTAQRLISLIDTMTKAHDKEVIEAFDSLVARMPAQGYGTMEFAMSPVRREALVSAGRQAMRDFFSRSSWRPRGGPKSLEAQRTEIADRVATSILE